MFLHDAVLEAIICGETEIPTDKYQIELQDLKEIDLSTGCSGLQSQFFLLSQVTPDPNGVFSDTAKAYPAKNRSSKFLPGYNIMHNNNCIYICNSGIISCTTSRS